MSRTIQKVLVVYKKSAYRIYFEERRMHEGVSKLFWKREQRRFKHSHDRHYETLEAVRRALRKRKLSVKTVLRTANVEYSGFDLIITVGGDGTFLEAARNTHSQLIMAVNSDISWSVGNFCCADKDSFEAVIDNVLNKQAKIKLLQRLELHFPDSKRRFHIVNDCLIAHASPGAMSRYYLSVNGTEEEQRSSGIWVSTAAGSTGAVSSAGGRILASSSRKWQYRPRELYRGLGVKYRLKGGLLNPDASVRVSSMMRKGMVYMDGSHTAEPLAFGERIVIAPSKYSLPTVFANK